MKFTAFLTLAGVVGASAFLAPVPQVSRAGPLAAAGKGTPEVGQNEYVPSGLTRQQWAEIKAAEAAKKAQKKGKKDIETLDEWQKEFEQGKTGHRFAKMKFDGWYKK